MKWLRITLAAVAVLLLAIVGVVAWATRTHSAAVWLAGRAVDAMDGRLRLTAVAGTLSGPLVLTGVRYRDPAGGLSFSAARVSVDADLWALLALRVHLRSVALRQVELLLPTQAAPTTPRKPTLKPPLDVSIDSFSLDGAQVRRGAETLLQIRHAGLAGQWTASGGIVLRQLTVDSPQGNVTLQGRLQQTTAYVGNAAGHFNLRAGGRTYAGELNVTSDARAARAHLQLTAPLAARVDLRLGQRTSWPWQIHLEVPPFDPADIMPGSRLGRAGATLSGSGDSRAGKLTGRLLVDTQQVELQTLTLARTGKVLAIESLALRAMGGAASGNLSGKITFGGPAVQADLRAHWRDVRLPAKLMGETLATRGDVRLQGSTTAYAASGQLRVGPPGHPSDVVLDVSGTPRSLQVKRLAVVQQGGQLAASGVLGFAPRINWRLDARASHFDPGAVLPAWRGRLSFVLATRGSVGSGGPQGSFTLTGLQGTLRNRPLSGEGHLSVRADGALVGTLKLRSGASTLQVSGASESQMNVSAHFDIAALDDWLPGAAGTLRGQVDARGSWPHIAVHARARGRGLRADAAQLGSLRLTADVTDLQQPSGSAELRVRDASVGEFHWSDLQLHLMGGRDDHTLSVDASGEPLGLQLKVHGAATQHGWRGQLAQLGVDVARAGHFALQNPSALSLEGSAFQVGETCLANPRSTLCVAAQRRADGVLQAHYRIHNLPLQMVAAVVGGSLPFAVEGMVDGSGDVLRDADGTMHGQASLLSGSGRLLSAGVGGTALLTYANFVARAALDGDGAHLTLASSLGQGGTLHGDVVASGLTTAAPTFRGEAHVLIDDVAPLELFTPQLAQLHGRLTANASIDGPLDAPNLAAKVQVSGLASEIPTLGLAVKDGSFDVAKVRGGALTLSGTLASGDGKLTVQGAQVGSNGLRVTVRGAGFVAANLPGASVQISPDVLVQGNRERLDVSGTITVPQARVNLQKLPKAGPPGASPDVVVVDEPQAARKRAQLPLFTDVTVQLGKDVQLNGFGLDAKVDGRIIVRERPDEPPLGSGEAHVSGTYKAYGQDLTIERGTLLYANTPLNNPRLDIAAYRKIQNSDVKPELLITGSALAPQLAVTAQPAMSQAEALAYLVTGRPLSSASADNGDVLQSAARSLGSAAGNLVAKNIGRRLGISQIGVASSEALGGSAFTIGQYLSPRLFLSYGVGLFTPGEVVTLRFQLTHSLQLRAESASTEMRAALDYKVGDTSMSNPAIATTTALP